DTAPVANDFGLSLVHDRTLNITPADLLAHASDADGDDLTVSAVGSPSHGSLQPEANGSWTYTPNAGYTGTDSFTYQVSDGALTATATVTLTVTNQAPVALDDAFDVTASQEGAPFTLNASVRGSDADGDTVTFTLVSGPSHGTLTFHGDGTFSY